MKEYQIIPIFPLALVQFPGALTPLHIFESRYKKMLDDVMAGNKRFGIIYKNNNPIDEGGERIGCSVEVAVIQRVADGRSNILCSGDSRFRIERYIEGEPYARAEVELFGDEMAFEDLSVETARLRNLFERLFIARSRLDRENFFEADEMPELPDDPEALSLLICSHLEIGLPRKQRWLASTNTRQRLSEIIDIVAPLTEQYEAEERMGRISKTNGHGKLPPGL